MRKWPTLYRQYTKGILYIALPLILLLLISNFYTIQITNIKVAESNRRMVSNWAEEISDLLGTIDLYLSNLYVNEQEFDVLAARSKEDEANIALLSLQKRLDTANMVFPQLNGLYVYSTPNSIFASRYRVVSSSSYQQRELVRSYIGQVIENGKAGEMLQRWVPCSVGDENYIIRFFGRDDTYIVATISLMDLMGKSTDDEVAVAYQSLSNSELLTGQAFFDQEGIKLADGNDDLYYLSGKSNQYMIIHQPLEKAGVSMVFILSGSGFLSGLTGMQIILLILSFSSILLVYGLHFWVNRWLYTPIRQLNDIMKQIQSGDLEAQLPADLKTREFMQVRDTFHNMMSQINILKIDAYEQEIQRQRIELQYLHMQIRPHFFLNCLKSVYAIAEQRKHKQVQEMILGISQHIRYWFQDSLTTVALEDEVEHACNYIRIQQLSLMPAPSYEVHIDDQLRSCHLPPFTVQTFVENSIKHEWRVNQPLHIVIKATLLHNDDGDYVDVIVADNGDGFPPDILDTLNDMTVDINQQQHIGLANIKHRLRLIYGERAVTAFYNNQGSVSEIIIPVHHSQPEGEEDNL